MFCFFVSAFWTSRCKRSGRLWFVTCTNPKCMHTHTPTHTLYFINNWPVRVKWHDRPDTFPSSILFSSLKFLHLYLHLTLDISLVVVPDFGYVCNSYVVFKRLCLSIEIWNRRGPKMEPGLALAFICMGLINKISWVVTVMSFIACAVVFSLMLLN